MDVAAPSSRVGRDPLAIPAAVKADIRILVVDDDRTLREGCASVLELDGYNVTFVGRGDEALEVVRRRKFDIVLVDLYLQPISGIDILKATLETHRETIVVVMTGNPSVSSSIEALRAGAWDYLPKPFSATHLQVLVGRASHAVMVTRETKALRQQLVQQNGNSDKITLLGVAPAFRKAVELARKVAPTDASVMITGESGTGKEVIAQFIHHHSRRASRKLVPINCAALPEPLLESEMFGHRKGAFTGADRDKPGLLETANGGTLFLDELTEMSHPIQAKLLRVLQDGVVRRVGSEQQDATVDVRFVSATNRDPQEAVNAGILREDLFYRLRVVPIKLPPLRERHEDIPLLADHFMADFAREYGRRMKGFDAGARSVLQHYPWPGNVRELRNVIERLMIMVAGDAISASHLSFLDPTSLTRAEPAEATGRQTLHEARDQFERDLILRTLAEQQGNMSRTADVLGVERSNLYRKMKAFGIAQSRRVDEESEAV